MHPNAKYPVVRQATRLTASVVVGCAFLVGCIGDHFFHATGRVVSCTTAAPVAASRINITIDEGAAPRPYSATPSTDSQGKFDVTVAVYSDAWVTFNFQASGFMPLSHQFKGLTVAPVELCMIPDGAP